MSGIGKRIAAFLAAILLLCGSAFAVDEGQPTTIPVTLTVIRTVRSIDVTLPASLPVSVLDGRVMTADNLSIINHSKNMRVVVSGISVESGECTVAPYTGFPAGADTIALRINGYETSVSGPLDLTESPLPTIGPGGALPIQYEAKVAFSSDVSEISAAQVVFTLRAERA